DAVMLQLNHSLLDWHAAEPELLRDLVSIDPIARAKFARQYQVDDMRDHKVFLFDPILLGHGAASIAHSRRRGSRSASSASTCLSTVAPAAQRLGLRQVVVGSVDADGQHRD